MELIIYEPKEGETLQGIQFNYDDLRKELAEKLAKYEGLVYGENSIKEAKTDRASLNKFKKALEDRRIELKKVYLEPYTRFEAQVKDLVAMVDKPLLAIDEQVKNYEQVLKEEKLEGIKTFFADRVGDLEKLVSFDKVYNPRWMNASYKEADIHKEITALLIKVESDLKVITEIQSEYELQIKDTYLKDFDLTVALQEKTRLEEQAAKLDELKKVQEEKKAAAKAAEVKPALKPAPSAEREPAPESKIRHEVKGPPTFTLDFRVIGTREQLLSVKEYMDNNGIKYGAVPKEERKAI